MDVRLTKVDLLVVGSASAEYGALLQDLERRIGRYTTLGVRELQASPLRQGADAVVASEGARLEKALDSLGADPSRLVVAFDRTGEQLDSPALAERLLSAPRLAMIIGGACGLAPGVLSRTDLRLAFGKITLPHQLARLVATEQLYRSFRIARGEPYHH